MSQEIIKVNGMMCGKCKAAVEGALSKLDGVTSATVNLQEKLVDVEFDNSKVTIEQLKEEIEDHGYDVVS